MLPARLICCISDISNLFRQAKSQCDFLIAGVASDEIILEYKGALPVIPLLERLEIIRSIRSVDAAFPAMTWNKRQLWEVIRFDILFKGDDWKGAEKGKGSRVKAREATGVRRRRDHLCSSYDRNVEHSLAPINANARGIGGKSAMKI